MALLLISWISSSFFNQVHFWHMLGFIYLINFPRFLQNNNIFCMNVASREFPTLAGVRTVTRTTTMLHQRSEPEQLNRTRCEQRTCSLYSPVPRLARGIPLPRIGRDKLISGRAIWKLLWSALHSLRQFFFFSLNSEWMLWDVVTQLLWTGLPDPFSLHVDVEVCGLGRMWKDERRRGNTVRSVGSLETETWKSFQNEKGKYHL